MPDPYNYSLNLQSPLQAFAQGFQMTNAVRQQEQQRAQAQAQGEALRSIFTDRSPENMARVLLIHPELKEQITSSQSVLNDAQKKEDITFKTQLLTAYNGNRPEVATQLMEQRRAALANTPGKEQEAKALGDVMEAVKDNPEIAKNILSMQLAALDGDAYKAVFGGGQDLTSFQKDLVAAGIDPKSPEGLQRSQEFVTLKTDPIVEMETPSGGKFVGSRSEYYARYGGGAPAPTPKAPPRVGEVRNGYEFLGGNPADKSNYRKAQGGQTATPSGGFR